MGQHVEWSPAAVEDALLTLRGGSRALTEMYFDDAMPVISGCLRGMFVAAPGHDLISSDYSAIEAVVLAELAGETWRQEVFRTHGKIYEASAAKVGGVSLEEILAHKKETGSHHPLRKKGKVLELALGYGGWVGALVAFGADEFMAEQEMREAAATWRQESPAIVEFWGGQSKNWRPYLYGIEGAAICAVLDPGQQCDCRGIVFEMIGDCLYCFGPSERPLTYHRPRLRPSERRQGEWTLSYEGWNTNPKNGPPGWIRMDTYGPKLVENIVQKTANDIQRHGKLRQEAAGYRIVLHTYDENTAEVPEGWGSVEEFEDLMNQMPPWAANWPVKAAGGWRGKRYRKD
jgi:DNA polymerase